MEPLISSVKTDTQPLIQHNGQTEADFFIVMTFHVEFDEAHRVCTWLMYAFKVLSQKSRFLVAMKRTYTQQRQ